jgi:hypothetical protein
VHPHRHILTRAIGVTPDVDVDLWEVHVRTGDRLLLCSDGLSNEVDPATIGQLLSSIRDPRRAARALVKAANDHGGGDNITVVVIDVLVGEDRTDGTTYVTEVPASTPPATPAPQTPAPGPSDLPAPGGAMLLAPAGAAVAQGGVTVDTMARPGADLFVASPAPVAPPRPQVDFRPAEVGERERRGDRRRRLGIPRRVTLRVIVFVLLVLAVPAVAYGVVRWYATDNWYVTVHQGHLAIYQGRQGGMLGFEPKLVDETDVATTQVLADRLPDLRASVQETSLAAAHRYVDNLENEFQSQQQIAQGQLPSTTTTVGTAPPVSP